MLNDKHLNLWKGKSVCVDSVEYKIKMVNPSHYLSMQRLVYSFIPEMNVVSKLEVPEEFFSWISPMTLKLIFFFFVLQILSKFLHSFIKDVGVCMMRGCLHFSFGFNSLHTVLYSQADQSSVAALGSHFCGMLLRWRLVV